MKHRIEQDHQCTKIFAEYSMPKTQALVNSILAKKVSKSYLFPSLLLNVFPYLMLPLE